MSDDSSWAVPSLEDLHALADEIAEGESVDYFIALYSEPIQEVLKSIPDVGYSEDMKEQLEELYEAWEDEDFPHQETPDDDVAEGDPDSIPDPADV